MKNRKNFTDKMWTIGKNKYDLSEFSEHHPGGEIIIKRTKGLDVTTLFETYHAFADKSSIERILEKYKVDNVEEAEMYDFTRYREILELVRTSFSLNNENIKSNSSYYWNLLRISLCYIFCYYSSVYSSWNFYIRCLLSFLGGFFAVSLSFNIMHDASHYSMSGGYKVNELVSKIWNAIMLWNSKIWFYHHVLFHHSHTGNEELDPDTYHLMPFFSKNANKKVKMFNISEDNVFFLFVFFPGFYVGQILSYLKGYFTKRLWKMKLPEGEYYSTLEIYCISLSIFNFGNAGFILTFIFLISANLFYFINIFPNHDTLEIYNSEKTNDWAVMQITQSGNFMTRHPLWSLMFGGINHQIEHHLFPNVSSIHLPKISRIVKKYCLENNIPYHEVHSIYDAFSSFVLKLKKVNN